MGSGTSVEASMAVVSMVEEDSTVEEDLSGAMGAAQEATGIKRHKIRGIVRTWVQRC